jgi:hypothetical protein
MSKLLEVVKVKVKILSTSTSFRPEVVSAENIGQILGQNRIFGTPPPKPKVQIVPF